MKYIVDDSANNSHSNAICPEWEHCEFIPTNKGTNHVALFTATHGSEAEIMESSKQSRDRFSLSVAFS